MPSVKVRTGESIDKALRALKKETRQRRDYERQRKRNRFYDKPSVKVVLSLKPLSNTKKSAATALLSFC